MNAFMNAVADCLRAPCRSWFLPSAILAAVLLAALPVRAERESGRLQLAREVPRGKEAVRPESRNGEALPPTVQLDRNLAAAHRAYGVWSAQVFGAVIPETAAAGWRRYLGMNKVLGVAYHQLGMAAYQQENYAEAAPLLSVAHDFMPEDVKLLGWLGFAMKESGQYERALDLLFRATIEDETNHLLWVWLGDVQRLLGKYSEAAQSFLRARDLGPEEHFDMLNDYVLYTQGLENTAPDWGNFERHREIALRHNKNRRFLRLIVEYMNALDVAPESGLEEGDGENRRGWVHAEIGTQYSYLQQQEAAIDHYKRAIHWYKKANSRPDLMRNYQNVAVNYSQLAEREPVRRAEYLQKASEYWDQSIALARELGDANYLRYARGWKLKNLAALKPLGDQETAKLREQVRMELPWQGPINDYTLAAAAGGEITCRLKEGDLAGARVLIEMTLPFLAQSNFLMDNEEAVLLNAALSAIYFRQGHYKESIAAADRAIETIGTVRGYLDSESNNRGNTGKALRHAYSARMRASIAAENPREALEYFEVYKNQAQRDVLGAAVRDESAMLDYAAETDIVRRRIRMTEAEIAPARTAGDNDEARRLEARLAQDQSRLAWLERGANLTPPNRLSYREVPTASMEEIQGALGDAVLLCYLFDSWGGQALILTREGVEGVILEEAKEDTLNEIVIGLHAALAQRDNAAANKALKTLYGILTAPIRDSIAAPMVYVASDGILNYIPFDALHAEGAPIMEDAAVAHIANGSYLAHAARKPRAVPQSIRAVLALEGAPALDGVTALPVERHSGADAVEGRILEGAPRGGVLYAAAEADLAYRNPMIGSLALAGAPGRDGKLYAAELPAALIPASLAVLHLRYPAPLVPDRGQEWAAFSEGFLHAGTPALLVNRWNVDAAEADALLSRFYNALPAQGPAAALQEAKRTARAESPDSLAWAAFTLYGPAR